MPIEDKYKVKGVTFFRDVRPWQQRTADWFGTPSNAIVVLVGLIATMFLSSVVPFAPKLQALWDVNLILGVIYVRWYAKREFKLPFKLPRSAAPLPDPRNNGPQGKKRADGILFLGNDRKKDDEVWLTADDARTHIMFLGTTGSGKTKGLEALATNALCWASGFTFVDGKADTSTWAEIYALARRFGRDDDLLVINYMTGNSDAGSTSNSMNPFSSGSASYLVQMLVSLLSEGGGENQMWKDRAIALISALMPALTFRRDKQNQVLDIEVIRDNFAMEKVIAISRDKTLPLPIVRGLKSYLDTLPGYVDEAFEDDGSLKPAGPDTPVFDISTASQQHGYLSMQFTKSLQSLAGDYGYIFKAQLADVDVIDVVLNRRILVVLIPALEKSADEAANLGKIVAAAIKGMMGSTLGASVEGSWETAIENKPTNSASPYMTIFDEVGYYTAQGMAVMAAQARSLGFSLVFAAQDLPAMEKRVKEEARSIAGNCNLKIFGKLEDPTGTREFFERSVGKDSVMQISSKKAVAGGIFNQFADDTSASIQSKDRASYDALKEQRDGQVTMLFAEHIVEAQMPYIDAGKPRALRIQKLLPVPATTLFTEARDRIATDIAARLTDSAYSAGKSADGTDLPPLLEAAVGSYRDATEQKPGHGLEAGAAAVARLPDPALLAANQAMPQSRLGAKPNQKASQSQPAAQAKPRPSATAADQRTPPRRAPLGDVQAAPSEQDLARVQVKTTSRAAPFQLPQAESGDAKQLRDMASGFGKRLFGK